RFARHCRVFFFEEPVYSEGEACLKVAEVEPNVWVCRPHTPHSTPGFHDAQLATLRELLTELVRERKLAQPVVWLYTPMALPLLQDLDPAAIVYDCMDELAAFKNPPKQLLQRESALLKVATLVFTGGPSLYQSKKARHPAVHCFPSSVDRAHFAAALDPGIEHPEQAGLARPRLGFFGVIDERFDVELLRALTAQHPEWQFVLVGPVVKIDPAQLPRAPNVHYFGQRGYEELPRFLAGWDVCLLPFALNEATRYISPTKTLEYMAAEKPIVSTAVADVAEPYGDIVRVAGASDFGAACAAALHESAAERELRVGRMRTTVAGTSWDRTAERMRELIDAALRTRKAAQSQFFAAGAPQHSCGVAIVGAGPTGLSAAYHLGEDSVLFEKNSSVGGWCRSQVDRGFTFDCAGHIMFSNDPYVHDMYRVLLGENVHWQDREAWIYSKSVYTRYPFQGALYGLPPEVISECIVGAVEARLGGTLRGTGSGTGSGGGGSSPSAGKAESITDCCADGVAESTAPLAAAPRGGRADAPPANFEEFIYRVWGRGVAKHFAIPYNRKLWAVPLSEMETSWLGGRVPLPDLQEMIEGALRPVGKPMGPNARFGYPLRGGFQALMNGFLPHLRGELQLNARIVRIFPGEHRLVLEDGAVWSYDRLISTMPLPQLVRALGQAAPPRVQEAAARLRHVSVRCVNLGIGRAQLTDKHWIYYPEDPVFHRIFVQGNASPYCNPPGGFGLTCEITYSPDKPLPCEGEALIERCIADCIKVGMLRADDVVLARNQVDMPYAYVVYDHARAANVATIRSWLAAQDIILAGRYSEWEYYNSDHAFLAGRKAAVAAQGREPALPGARPLRSESRALSLNS
ncbi:MAG: NAD(P)-binding protein, partial [Gammaproteobacteria bacterium]|nr:NAD(P)-binding protein [Gammaproteobacteria bacterium]